MARAHGSSGYTGGCRCTTCKDGKRAALRDLRRALAYGRPTTDLVDAAPVREHLRSLMATGASLDQIVEEAGVSYGVPSRILYRGQKRVKANSAAAILSLRQVDASASRSLVDGAGTRRRAQALAFLGWSLVWQARQLGVHHIEYGGMVRTPGKRITASTVTAMKGLFDQYWDQRPPMSRAASLSRHVARRNGYLPPAAWDDDLIDLPEEELEAELARRVALMDPGELYRADQAVREGERSPLIVAASDVYRDRRNAGKRAARAAKKHTTAA